MLSMITPWTPENIYLGALKIFDRYNLDGVPVHDDVNCVAVQQRPDPAGGYQMVSHHLEEVRVEALAVVVWPLDGAAHAGRQALHLDADT